MEFKGTSLLGGQEIGISFTDKPVTAWGGMALIAGLGRQIGLEEALRKALPFELTSPNATDPVEIVLAFMAGVLVGSRRLAHIERLRWDIGVQKILGINRFVSDTTLARFFQRFTAGAVTTTFDSLMRWELSQINLAGKIMDLDSTIFERFGKQEGARLGYNPNKHRRPSHHPLLATLGQRPWVVHAWLRSGNTSSARGAEGFLQEAMALLPEGVKIRFLRGDAGFGMEPFLSQVEEQQLHYAIVARFTKGLKRQVAAITDWRGLDADTAVSETMFQAHGWSRPRRIILIRQHTKDRDFIRGRELFDDPAYAYQAIATDLRGTPESIWRFYRGHAEVESNIRELKWDYGIDGFCQKKFFATEAMFRMVCVTYNLMGLLQEKLGKTTYQTLGTLRSQLLAVGAVVGNTGGRTVLRLSLAGPWREQFIAGLATFFPTKKTNCAAVGTG